MSKNRRDSGCESVRTGDAPVECEYGGRGFLLFLLRWRVFDYLMRDRHVAPHVSCHVFPDMECHMKSQASKTSIARLESRTKGVEQETPTIRPEDFRKLLRPASVRVITPLPPEHDLMQTPIWKELIQKLKARKRRLGIAKEEA